MNRSEIYKQFVKSVSAKFPKRNSWVTVFINKPIHPLLIFFFQVQGIIFNLPKAYENYDFIEIQTKVNSNLLINSTEEKAKEVVKRAAAAARRWREYSRRGADKPPTLKLPEAVSNREN